MFEAGHDSSSSRSPVEPAPRFTWLRPTTGGRLDSTGIRVGIVEVNAVIPEAHVRPALDSLVAQFRAVRSYRCRFRGNPTHPNLDLISKDLRAALERLGHEVGRTLDGTRGVRWIEGSGNVDVDEATIRALAAHVTPGGFVQITVGTEAWFWTFKDGTLARGEGRHPLALMDARGALIGREQPPDTGGRTA